MLLVSDANIFIDLQKLDLLHLFDKLGFTVATSDFVFAELNALQQSIIKSLHIEIYTMDGSELLLFYQEFQDNDFKKISYQDYSIFYFARKYDGEVLSNDKRLREYAKQQKVSVRGLFFILDTIIELDLITQHEMVIKLKLLLKINKRIPQNEVDCRIIKWSDK